MLSSTTNPTHQADFLQRRATLAQRMRAQYPNQISVAVIPTASECVRNRDSHYDFRPDSYFYYLTGFNEPEAVLLLRVTPDTLQSWVFCRPKNLEREIWDGYRLGPEAAVSQLHVDAAYAIDEWEQQANTLLARAQVVFAPPAHAMPDAVFGARWQASVAQLYAQARSGIMPPVVSHDVYQLLDEMRLRKEPHELALMRTAGQISAAGHIRALQTARVGLCERDLEAEIRYEFTRRGAADVAYNTIVATGANACVLHYRAGWTPLADGDLCLIDAGAEYGLYAGDITRTFPVNGRFTRAQQAVYEVVLAAQQAAIDQTRPDVPFDAAHRAAVATLTQGLLDLGILNRAVVGSLEDAIAQRAYAPFYMHRTGHWLGLDVHDCGAYAVGQIEGESVEPAQIEPVWRSLEEGMVLTIEPGLYIRPSNAVDEAYWDIGIRIEDDAIITASGCELTTRDVPVTVQEIEALMRSGKT